MKDERREVGSSRLREERGRLLDLYALTSGISIALATIVHSWWSQLVAAHASLTALSGQDPIGNLTFYNGLIVITLGAFVLLRGELKDLKARIGVSAYSPVALELTLAPRTNFSRRPLECLTCFAFEHWSRHSRLATLLERRRKSKRAGHGLLVPGVFRFRPQT
jgi:hypothetical protein